MRIQIDRIDHFVLTVESIDRAVAFYADVLGMTVQRLGTSETPRTALTFGGQKINLHQAGRIPDPNVLKPTPGSADFCLITSTPLTEVAAKLGEHGVGIIEGPVTRTGATGTICSIYVRDPDQNLVEIANYRST
jgi:catechol 2,3-dioxygenase-like lactoylglutathione lyase family enzyme